MEINMEMNAETFKKFQKFLAIKETMEKYKKMEITIARRNKAIKKYSQSEKGKARRREASRRYYAKKKAEKLLSNNSINAVSNQKSSGKV